MPIPAAPAKKKRKLIQAFTAPKNKETKAIIKKNETSSPLLRLPLELRLKIWGYVLGHQLIHIDMEGMYPDYGYIQLQARLFNTICQSPVTEGEAYELSKSAEYNNAATSFKAGEDMRFCGNRHDACRTELRNHDKKEDLPPNRLKVGALTVCRQVYVEANPILWSTTTWSFHYKSTFRCWMSKRNAIQKRLMKKIHLMDNVAFDFMTKATISGIKGLEEVNIDIYSWCRPDLKDIMQFFRVEKITVIAANAWQTHDDRVVDDRTTFEERVAMAEEFRTHLMTLQTEATRKKQEKESAKLLTEGDKNAEGEMNAEGEKNAEGQTKESEN